MAPVHSPHLSLPVTPQFEVNDIQSFTEGRAGIDDHRNEDRVVAYMTDFGPILAAVDGITPLTGWRNTAFGETVTAGRLAAEIVASILKTLAPLSSFEEALQRISNLFEFTRAADNIPDHEILGAVFCAYIPWEGDYGGFWQMGDCGYGYHKLVDGQRVWVDSLNGKLADNSDDANLRAEVIEGILADEKLDYATLNKFTRGRLVEEGWNAMQKRRAERLLTDHNYDWLRSAEGLASKSKPVHRLERPVTDLVVVSDGWEIIPQNQQQGLARLTQWREADSMMIGRNPEGIKMAKGFADQNGDILPYPDDVCLARATFKT